MNIRKLTIFVLIFIVILTFFTGCTVASSGAAKSSNTFTQEAFGFETVYYSGNYRIYREITTDVLYFNTVNTNAGGLSVMLNPETGKPLTYSEWKDNYEK